MAIQEVIHFPFEAQLSTCSLSPASFPPEPVVKSPPLHNNSNRSRQRGPTRLAMAAAEAGQRQPPEITPTRLAMSVAQGACSTSIPAGSRGHASRGEKLPDSLYIPDFTIKQS